MDKVNLAVLFAFLFSLNVDLHSSTPLSTTDLKINSTSVSNSTNDLNSTSNLIQTNQLNATVVCVNENILSFLINLI